MILFLRLIVNSLLWCIQVRIGGRISLRLDLPVTEFDPGIVGKDSLPSPCDLLVATDVLEHVEPDRVDLTLRYMRTLAKKGAFFIISLGKSSLTLPNGLNAHLSRHSANWWLDKLADARFVVTRAQIRKGLFVWAR